MNKIFNQIMGVNSPSTRQPEPRIKGKGKIFDLLSEIAKSKGLELYADHNCKIYWLWKDGNSIDGTYDGFNKLSEVKEFLNTYQPNFNNN